MSIRSVNTDITGSSRKLSKPQKLPAYRNHVQFETSTELSKIFKTRSSVATSRIQPFRKISIKPAKRSPTSFRQSTSSSLPTLPHNSLLSAPNGNSEKSAKKVYGSNASLRVGKVCESNVEAH